MSYSKIQKTYYWPSKNGMSGAGDKLTLASNVAMIAVFGIVVGGLYWVYVTDPEKGTKKNPGSWGEWKKAFEKEFQKNNGTKPRDHGIQAESFMEHASRGLAPETAVEIVSREADGSSDIGRSHHENPSGYYVSVKASRAEGLPGWVRGPYSLASAKDYARIGSQTGRDRRVTRGKGGPIIRRYSGGKRAWPVTETQAKKLKPHESPRRL